MDCGDIDNLENQLELYMRQFHDLVEKTMKINSKKADISKVANNLRNSHRKMVDIVDGMKFLDEKEQDIYSRVKSYEMKNQNSLRDLSFVDSQIEKIGQEVEFSLTAIPDLK